MDREVFLDTAFAIALVNATDEHHQRAIQLSAELQAAGTQMVTTQAVLLEVGNGLSRQRYRSAAVSLLDALEADPAVEVIPLTDDLFTRAGALFAARHDKEWGLTDCLSFVVMEDRGLREALTTDRHFEQAGFRALLR